MEDEAPLDDKTEEEMWTQRISFFFVDVHEVDVQRSRRSAWLLKRQRNTSKIVSFKASAPIFPGNRANVDSLLGENKEQNYSFGPKGQGIYFAAAIAMHYAGDEVAHFMGVVI